MSSSFAINVNTVPSNDEKAFNSYNLEPTLDEKKLIETVEKAVKISADIAIGEKIVRPLRKVKGFLHFLSCIGSNYSNS